MRESSGTDTGAVNPPGNHVRGLEPRRLIMASFTESEMRGLLLKVGLNPVPENATESTFAQLGLDSLARIQIATHLRETHGADVEADLVDGRDLTMEEVVAMVNAALTTTSR
jgi:acyl carrier protein